MKVYLLNKDLDNGYVVQAVFALESAALKCAEKYVELEIMCDESFNQDRVWIEEFTVIE